MKKQSKGNANRIGYIPNNSKKIATKLKNAIRQILKEQSGLGPIKDFDTGTTIAEPGKDPTAYNPAAGGVQTGPQFQDAVLDKPKDFESLRISGPTEAIWKVVGIDPDPVTLGANPTSYPFDACGNWERSGTKPVNKNKFGGAVSAIAEIGKINPKLSKLMKENYKKLLKIKK